MSLPEGENVWNILIMASFKSWDHSGQAGRDSVLVLFPEADLLGGSSLEQAHQSMVSALLILLPTWNLS